MSAATGWGPDLVRELTAPSGRVPAVVTVVGPGGTGKSLLLAELATAHERAGLAVFDAVPEDPAALPGPVTVLVDDDTAVLAAARAAGFDVLPATWMGDAPALREAQEEDGRT